MKRMTESEARRMALGLQRQRGVRERDRDENHQRFLVVVRPRWGRPYGLECMGDEFAELRREAGIKIEILRQPRVFKRAGEKSYTREFPPVPSGQSERKAFRAARADFE